MDDRRSLCFIWIFTVLGSGCLLASCATNYWQQDKITNKIHQGLWQSCVESTCSKVEVYNKGNGKDTIKIGFYTTFYLNLEKIFYNNLLGLEMRSVNQSLWNNYKKNNQRLEYYEIKYLKM